MESPNKSVAVLVVEDEDLVRSDMAATIEEAGFKVIEACSADDAAMLFRDRADIDLLFTDIEMPGAMDGLGLVRYARACSPEIKIIVTSGRRKPQSSDLPNGAVFLSKPCGPYRLIEQLETMTR